MLVKENPVLVPSTRLGAQQAARAVFFPFFGNIFGGIVDKNLERQNASAKFTPQRKVPKGQLDEIWVS